jgi:hypothetical protein
MMDRRMAVIAERQVAKFQLGGHPGSRNRAAYAAAHHTASHSTAATPSATASRCPTDMRSSDGAGADEGCTRPG